QFPLTLAANAGKVALTRTSNTLVGFCPASHDLIDFVGYGGANCSEGGMPVALVGPAMAATRTGGGCIDTNRNAADFEITLPNPRTQADHGIICPGDLR
ncbi:MAG: hypothetical protein ABI885_28440, partial [Gammaproteobacteria bacterium]